VITDDEGHTHHAPAYEGLVATLVRWTAAALRLARLGSPFTGKHHSVLPDVAGVREVTAEELRVWSGGEIVATPLKAAWFKSARVLAARPP
jgi:hypothetical protein